MQPTEFWRTVTADESGFLDLVLAILRQTGPRFCVIGGQAVNAYAEPVVSLDLDLAFVAGDAEKVLRNLPPEVRREDFAHSVNLSTQGSDLRVQIQTDPRYASFPGRAEVRTILGQALPVASAEDVLQGKVWAASDPRRRPSKRQKDLADIARLLEVRPELRLLVPGEILERLVE